MEIPVPPKTGDKFAAQIVHNSNGSVTIKTWWNGILKHNYTDTTPVPSGNPGIGFFVSDGNADNRFGFSSITAANVGSEVDLSWSAVSGAVSYKIIRNGTQIDTSTTNTYVDAGLSSGTTYSYEVQAIDQSGNAIANSNTATTTAN